MKRQLEIVCLIAWVVILCIVFVENVPASEPTPLSITGTPTSTPTAGEKMSSQQFVCILTGGKWIDNMCIKPAKTQPTTSSTPSPSCNPLICHLTWHGKCINGECVKQDTEPGQMPSPTTTPRH